ncbi:hypothetical protein ISCGN_027496 [Ixodes scapularis]
MDTMAPKEVSPPKASGVVPLAPPSVLKEGPSQTTSSKELERTPSSSARSSGRGRALPTPASTSSRKPGQLDEAYSTASQQSVDEMMDESMPPSDDDLVPSEDRLQGCVPCESDQQNPGWPPWLTAKAVTVTLCAGGTCESRCLVSGVTTDSEPCRFTRPRLAVRGFPVSGEKGILVVEPSLGMVGPFGASRVRQYTTSATASHRRDSWSAFGERNRGQGNMCEDVREVPLQKLYGCRHADRKGRRSREAHRDVRCRQGSVASGSDPGNSA